MQIHALLTSPVQGGGGRGTRRDTQLGAQTVLPVAHGPARTRKARGRGTLSCPSRHNRGHEGSGLATTSRRRMRLGRQSRGAGRGEGRSQAPRASQPRGRCKCPLSDRPPGELVFRKHSPPQILACHSPLSNHGHGSLPQLRCDGSCQVPRGPIPSSRLQGLLHGPTPPGSCDGTESLFSTLDGQSPLGALALLRAMTTL